MEHGGYIANVVEVADDSYNSITIDYQYEKNNYSDSQFLKDYIERQLDEETSVVLVTDGGCCGMENTLLSDKKNITLVTTDMKGTDVSDH